MEKGIKALIQKHVDNGGFAGAALIVAKAGEVVIEEYVGEAAPGLPSAPDTLWPLASISKVYSAAAIMRLVELGELTLNTSVSSILPKFTGEDRETIRLRHLLTHTSGLIYESPEMEARLIAQTPLEAMVEEAYRASLLFKPGTSFSYADYNYLLASQVAAGVTGKPFAQLVQELVLEPMGLHHTFFPPSPEAEGRLAKIRSVLAEGTDGAMYNSAYALGLAHPAFGVVASAPDLVRFAHHFAPGGPRIHSELTVRAMTTIQTGLVRAQHVTLGGISPDCIVPWSYGFALQNEYTPALFSELASPRTFGHGGASGCQLVVDPDPNLIVALVSNTHARQGREQWYQRLHSIINRAMVLAAG